MYFIRLVAIVLGLLLSAIVSGQTTLLEENFNLCQTNAWTIISSASSTDNWNCVYQSGKHYMTINDNDGTDDEAWLISPSLDLNATSGEYMHFRYMNDGVDGLVLLYSTDYNGQNDFASVQQANWTSLPLQVYEFDMISSQLSYHQAIDISTISGTDVYFAFVYQSNDGPQEWNIDEISIYADYYSAIYDDVIVGLRCDDLKSSLHNHIDAHSRISYTSSAFDVWDAFYSTDKRNNDTGVDTIVWDMYSDVPNGVESYEYQHGVDQDTGGGVTGEGDAYNREHVFPKSWWGGGSAALDTQYTDLHHILPSDRFVNSKKSNHPLGYTNNPSFTSFNGSKVGSSSVSGYSGGVFEPIDAYKGDFARMYLYMITRYESNLSSWYTNRPDVLSNNSYMGYRQWLLDLLICWHESDPVSQKEIDRNNAVFAIQDNRNPFIDHPEYVAYIWGECGNVGCPISLPVDLVKFSGAPVIDGQTSLVWKVVQEYNVSHYSLQHSGEGQEFVDVASIEAHSNNEQGLQLYSYLHKGAAIGSNYYRLKIVDNDGTIKYSDIIHVEHKAAQFRLYPTLATNELHLDCPIPNVEMSIYSMSGILVLSKTFKEAATYSFDVSELDKGMYIVRLLGEGQYWQDKIQIVR